MSAIKKGHSETPEQINSRIQRKFDQVFAEDDINSSESTGSQSLSMVVDTSAEIGEIEMSSGAHKKEADESLDFDLDFSIEDELSDDVSAVPVVENLKESSAPKELLSDENGLDFSLDFDAVDELVPEKMSTDSTENKQEFSAQNSGLDLGSEEVGGLDLDSFQEESDFEENTQKTIVMSSNSNSLDLNSLSLDEPELQTTSDNMSNEEALANIESTIKDIIRPKLSNPDKTPSNSFSLSELMDEEKTDQFVVEVGANSQMADSSATGEFFIDPIEMMEDTPVELVQTPVATKVVEQPAPYVAPVREEVRIDERNNKLSDEDSVRYHATIRQLREEREELLGQIKHLKGEHKELEQDNLSLKAGLDEAKIEISILRKRHMVELEDLKYRLTLSEEKKALTEEKARQSELRREKLEQKVRIDYNQVKLREKELESKLEMLSMDIDSQVHSRDQKILELRRKIDALEFNMENASIKEQRSHEDKRKLEDKLGKIMKTLRNSIKNLEEDIDLVQEELPGTEKINE